MKVTPDQMGELDEEGVNERARGVSKNDGLLLCEGQVYALCETIGEENETAVAGTIKISCLGSSGPLTIEGSCPRGRRQIACNPKGYRGLIEPKRPESS